MDVLQELKKYTNLSSYETLVKVVKNPIYFSKEEVRKLIPSISMGTDGPILTNIMLITDHFIIDIRLQPQGEYFDYIALKTIVNYRFNLSDHIIKATDGKDIIYQVANIELLHNLQTFKTSLNYVGDDRKSWLTLVTESMPMAILL